MKRMRRHHGQRQSRQNRQRQRTAAALLVFALKENTKNSDHRSPIVVRSL